MLINMVLKTDELQSPQEVKRPSFVKISRAGKNGSMRNLLCFRGTTQCPRTTLRNWVEAFKKPQNPRPWFSHWPEFLKILDLRKLFSSQNMAFWQPSSNHVASQELIPPQIQLCVLNTKWTDVKRIFLKGPWKTP